MLVINIGMSPVNYFFQDLMKICRDRSLELQFDILTEADSHNLKPKPTVFAITAIDSKGLSEIVSFLTFLALGRESFKFK